jgi:hypothetical protein
MRISWTVEGKGGGHATVDTPEEASRALTGAIKAMYEHLPTDALVAVLGPIMGLRQRIVTEGAAAIERGAEWSATSGGVFVTLSPS